MDFLDLTRLVEPLRYLVGADTDNPAKRVAVNMASLPISGSLLDQALKEGAYASGLIDDKPFVTDPAEWERQMGSNVPGMLGRAGLIPGTFSSVYRAMERGGIGFEARTSAGMPPVEPQPKWMSAINAVMGGDFITRLGTPSQTLRARIALGYEVDKLERQLRALYAKTEGQSTGPGSMPLDREAAIKVQEQLLTEKLDAFYAAMDQLDKLSGGQSREPTRGLPPRPPPPAAPVRPQPPPRPALPARPLPPPRPSR